jgi:hypothetical protein
VGTRSFPRPGGGQFHRTPDGKIFETDKSGRLTSYQAQGVEATFNSKGKPDFVRHNDGGGRFTEIHSGPGGVTRVETVGPDRVRTVSFGRDRLGRDRGFQERPLMRRPGFVQRTYFIDGRVYVRIYHMNRFGYPVYVHPYYYHPAFYVWVGNPWAAQVYFGWGGAPWYSVYGGYFAPAPFYATPSAWMADYMISQNLQAAYAMQTDPVDGPPATPIPADVRAGYVQQVQQQVQMDQAHAGGTVSQPAENDLGALDPKFTIFSVYTATKAELNVQECDLTRGDFVRRLEAKPDARNTVAVSVASIAENSQNHCGIGVPVRLKLTELQDWYNSFVDGTQSAMEAAVSNSGKNNFPVVPDATHVDNADGQGTADDPHALGDAIQQQQANAKQIQTQVQQDACQCAFYPLPRGHQCVLAQERNRISICSQVS